MDISEEVLLDDPAPQATTPTPVLLPVGERLARLSRRRTGSTAGSASGSLERSASLYQQNIDDITKSKDREIERVRSRLKDALDEAEAAEVAQRKLSDSMDSMTSSIHRANAERDDLASRNKDLSQQVDLVSEQRRRSAAELAAKKRECTLYTTSSSLVINELDRRLSITSDESAHRTLLTDVYVDALESGSQQLWREASALRKQVKDMQIRIDGLIELNRESLRLQQSRADAGAAPASEAMKEELAAMRREKNEALGALRAEKLAHSHLHERFEAVQAAREKAYLQLSSERAGSEQRGSAARDREGNSWVVDKGLLQDALKKKVTELAAMTKKRERAKRKEQETAQELASTRALCFELRQQLVNEREKTQFSAQSVPQPPWNAHPDAYHIGYHPTPSFLPPHSQTTSRSGTPMAYPDPCPGHVPPQNNNPASLLHLPSQHPPPSAAKDAEVAFLRSRVRELTHQGRYATGFATPPPTITPAP
ncbi:hypothetical protein DIPPA_18320 [Diplonema papillatum]|nr:hypothetical protein DIPPA_18320 [Diplonema papillatum]|eukprot:gene7749-11903_t